MKKIIALVMCGLLFLPTLGAAAEDIINTSSETAVLTAQVPEQHTVSISTDGNGSVVCGNSPVSNEPYTFKRFSPVPLLVFPNTGYRLSRLTVDSVDVTDKVKGSVYLIQSLHSNVVAKAEFIADTQLPTENNLYTLKLHFPNIPKLSATLGANGEPVATDGSGNIIFNNVAPGQHTIIISDGKRVISVLPITLNPSEAAGGASVKLSDDGFFDLSFPSSDTVIDLTLDAGETDSVTGLTEFTVGSISTSSPSDFDGQSDSSKQDAPDGFIPETSDGFSPVAFLAAVLSLLAATALLYSRRKQR